MFKIIAQPEGGQNFVEENHMQINVMGLRTSQPSMNKVQQALKKGFGELVAKHFISAFQRAQTGHRVKDTLQAMLTQGVGRRTLTNSLVARGLEQKDWSADYRAFSVGKWDPVDLFEGVFKAAVPLLGREGPVVLGIDDTGLPKTGVNLEFAGWIHNPLVPKYVHPAIQWGIPILHAALLIQGEVVHRPTAISVAFEPIQREKKEKRRSPSKQQAKGESCPCPSDEVAPSKKCGRPTKEETALRQAERDAVIRDEGQDLTGHAVTDVRLKATELAVRVIWRVRKWMDAAGMPERTLVVVGDNSYTNGTVMLNLPHHTLYVGRTRPDSQLQAMGPTTKGGRLLAPTLSWSPSLTFAESGT